MSPSDIELDDLRPNVGTKANTEHDDPEQDPRDPPALPKDDGVIATWAWSSAIIILLAAVPLLLSPKLLLFLSETGSERRAALTPLETFLAWNTGILLFALALALVFNVPSSPEDLTARRGSPGHPLLEPLSAASALVSLFAYNTSSVGSLALLICLGSGTIGLWGFWAMLFAGSSRISHKTGADKRTSRFIFGNKSAASAQKKRWKNEQPERSQFK